MILQFRSAGGLLALSVLVLSSVGDRACAQERLWADGRVVAVDRGHRTITLDHGPIPGLMPSGRAAFVVERNDLLGRAEIGEHVRFLVATRDESHGLLMLVDVKPQVLTNRGETNTGRMGFVFWVVPTIVLAVAGAGGYLAWRRLREIRRSVLDTARTQDELRQSVGLVAQTLEAIADTARNHLLADLGRRLESVKRALGTGEAPAGDTGRPAVSPLPRLVVVRRGEAELFRALEVHLEASGLVHLMWDRRVGQRRTARQPPSAERRKADRRSPLPMLWETHGFLLAHRAASGTPGPPGLA